VGKRRGKKKKRKIAISGNRNSIVCPTFELEEIEFFSSSFFDVEDYF